MKTIKLIVKISGYLNAVDSKDFDIVEKSVEVGCEDSLNEVAKEFLKDSFNDTFEKTLKAWVDLKSDFKGVQSES